MALSVISKIFYPTCRRIAIIARLYYGAFDYMQVSSGIDMMFRHFEISV